VDRHDKHDDDHEGKEHRRPHHGGRGGGGHHEHDDERDDDDDKPNPGKDKKRCARCYGKVVSKYVKTVLKIGAKVCNQTKCEYVQRVCKYLKEHKEYTVGLIIGGLRPFKFAAGYCMGAKQCRPQPRPHFEGALAAGRGHGPMKMHKEFMYGAGGHDMMIKTMIQVAQQFV